MLCKLSVKLEKKNRMSILMMYTIKSVLFYNVTDINF